MRGLAKDDKDQAIVLGSGFALKEGGLARRVGVGGGHCHAMESPGSKGHDHCAIEAIISAWPMFPCMDAESCGCSHTPDSSAIPEKTISHEGS